MRFEFVLSLLWVAVASGASWHEPLLGGVKISTTELDRLGKEAELIAHKVVDCFSLPGGSKCNVRCRIFWQRGRRQVAVPILGARIAQVRRSIVCVWWTIVRPGILHTDKDYSDSCPNGFRTQLRLFHTHFRCPLPPPLLQQCP